MKLRKWKWGNITPFHLQQENIGPSITEALKKLRLEKSSADGCLIILKRYPRSPFRDFQSYLRVIVGLVEKCNQLILKQYIWNFVTYKITPEIYTIKGFSEAVYTMRDHEGTLQNENDDISNKKDLFNSFWRDFWNVTRSWWTFFLLIFYWTLHRCSHADSPSVYTSEKTLILSTIDKVYLKCNVFDSRVVNVLRQPIFLVFFRKTNRFYNIFEPETIHYRKVNIPVLKTRTFYLETDNHKEVNFKGGTLTITSEMMKVWTLKWSFKNLKRIVFALKVDIYLIEQKFMVIWSLSVVKY